MKLLRKFPLVSYFALAYAITWIIQLAGIILGNMANMRMSNETNYLAFVDLLSGRLSGQQALAYLVFALGMGPLLAGVIMTAVLDGRSGLRDLWVRCTRWKVGWKWYAFIVVVPLALNLLALGVTALVNQGGITLNPKLPWAHFLPFALYMIVFTGIVEEPGWRGFALPRLQSRYTADRASWILGVLWGVWHFPFMIYYSDPLLGPGVLIGSLVGLVMGTIGWTLVNTFLYNNTESVFMAILLHGLGNAFQSYLVLASGNLLAQTLFGLLPWVIAIIISKKYGDENLARRPRPQIEIPA